MSRQLDQLPADATSLARDVAALKREMREMRAAHRLASATIGLVQTAPSGARVLLNQETQSLQVYGSDGTTLLAELGPDASGGGGLWTRGRQDPDNISSYLSSGELSFRPVQDGVVGVPASISYDEIEGTSSDLTIDSGAIGATDWRAVLDIGSVAGGTPSVQVQGFREVSGAGVSGNCSMGVQGVFTAYNFAWGTTNITPSAANTPTSAAVSGLTVAGSTFMALVTANTSVPGTQVTGVSFNNLTSSGLTLWLTRTNTTTTTLNWMIIGL